MKRMNNKNIIIECGLIYICVVLPICVVHKILLLPHLLFILIIITVILDRKYQSDLSKVDESSKPDATSESDNSPSVENGQAIPANGSEKKSKGQQDKESPSTGNTFSEIVKEISNKPGSTIYKCNVLDVLVEPQEKYIRYRFFVDRDIRIYDSSGVEKTTRQVFSSNYAICFLLKQYEDLSWLSMAITDNYCIPLDVKRLLIGSTIEILQENVLKGSLYTHPFTRKSDANKIEHNIFFNHIIAIYLCDTAEQYLDEYATKILEGAIKPCIINKKIAEFVAACEEANIDHIQSLYDSCPRVSTQGEDTVDCTKKFQEVITRQVDKLESFIDETDIAKIQQIKESFFDKASDATREQFKKEFKRAEELLNGFAEEYEAGIPILDITSYVDYSLGNSPGLQYPYCKTPELNTKIFPYRRQKALRKGVSEEKFCKMLRKYIKGADVLDDISLHIYENAAIEPDIAIVTKSGKNIRLDIEIDEPYSGYDRKPIHYLGCGDDIRDENLTKVGWITLRFAEEQIVWSPLCAIRVILRFLNKIDSTICIPKELNTDIEQRGEKFNKIPRWTKDDAVKMAEMKYRENYLQRSAFGEVLNQLPTEYGQTSEEKKILDGVNLLASKNNSVDDNLIHPDSGKKLVKTDKQRAIEFTSQEYGLSQTVDLSPIVENPVPGGKELKESPYLCIRPNLVSTGELISYYFPASPSDASCSNIHKEEYLNAELRDFYILYENKTYSAEFHKLKEFIENNNIQPRNVFMELYDPKYNVRSSISFISGSTLYSCRIQNDRNSNSERGIGIAASLENAQRNRIDVEETMKALILEERYLISIDHIRIIEIDTTSMTINERKAIRQITGKNILHGDYWDRVKTIS